MLKAIEEFSQAIDLQRSKVKKGSLKITVFGGPTTDSNNQPTSQRGIFLLRSSNLADAFVVPEDFKNWNHFGVYDDLLSFEEDVCSLTDSVLIFLESAGAIAELGTLIKHRDIAPKLLVVIQNEHHQESSFITLGLLNHLKEKYRDDKQIVVSQHNKLELEECRYIGDSIKTRFNTLNKTELFRTSNVRHVLYLIVDFIELLQVAEFKDIKAFLEHLKLQYTKKKRLEQLLLTLKNIGLIREQTILGSRCFFICETENPNIEYAFKGTPSKRITWKTILFTKAQEQEWRRLAFKMLRASQTEDENVN